MTKRVMSGFLCAFFLLLVMFLSTFYPFALNLAVSIVCAISSYELLLIKNELKISLLSVSSILFSVARPLFGGGTKLKAFLYVYMIICFVISMERFIKNKKAPPSKIKSVWNVCFVFFMNIIVSTSISSIVEIRNFGKELGLFLSSLTLVISWMCDVGSYIFGKKFGNNKLCPYISPKKTVEGAVGGIFTSVVSAMLFCFICESIFKSIRINYSMIFIMSLLGAPISILGDLCFSLVKRLLIVKDFSDIIPGHGGVLDRFDSVIFLSPFVLIFIHIFDLSR